MQVKLNNVNKLIIAKRYIQKFEVNNEIVQEKVLTADKVKPTSNYLNCLILLEPEKTIKANCFVHCEFVYNDEKEYNNSSRVFSNIAFPFCPNYRRIRTTVSLDNLIEYPYVKIFNVLTAQNVHLEQAYYKTNGSPLLEYRERRFAFDLNQVIAGVELELPVLANNSRYQKRLFSDFWFVDTDYSQIVGNLELQSVPTKIDYFTSGMFRRRLRTVYKKFVDSSNNVPPESDYVRDDSHRGSGVHLHIGFACNAFSASDLRDALYSVTAELGGTEFLMTMGGKKLGCLEKYSPFIPTLSSKNKYQAFRVVTDTTSEKQVELRYMASSPNPDVVFNRILTAVSLVEQAITWLENREADNLDKALTQLTLLRARSLRV